HYRPDTLLESSELLISKPPDDKLFFISVDEKTGGTYHPYYTLLYYRIDSTHTGVMEMGEPTFDVLGIVDATAPVYLVASFLSTCATCTSESVYVLSKDSVEVNLKDIYNYEG